MMLLLLTLLSAAPEGPDLPAQIKAQLGEVSLVRGVFEQQKQVKGFKKPLISTGDFVVAKGRGVKWHTKTPFESVLTVRKDDISSKQGETEVFHLDASKEPTVRIINSVLFALLAGDVEILRTHFEVKGAVKASGWTLELTPKTRGLAQVLSGISIEGDRFVRHLELSEGSGDKTSIRVTSASDGPPLSDEEQRGW